MKSSLFARALAFALPLLAALAALEHAVEYGRSRSYTYEVGKINRVMQHRVSPELAIFGASNALIDFDAPLIERLTGKATYNYGVAGIPFTQYQALLRELVTSSPRCDEVVLAETYATFSGLGAVLNAYMWLPYVDAPAMYEVLRRIDPAQAWKARYVPLYPLVAADQGTYKTALRGYLSLLGRPPPDDQVQGYLAKDEDWKPPQGPLRVLEYPFDPRALVDFVDVIALLNRAGKRVTVVMSPIAEPCRPMLPELDVHRALLRSLVGEGNAFLDYTGHPISRDTANFYNCLHLNRAGAAAFSRIFAADLAALPRRDPAR